MTLERFKEWIENNYPPERYFNVQDLISDVELRLNSDGHDMNEKVRQLLLDQFAPYYDPYLRELEARRQEKLEIARYLGNGTIPTSLTDEIIMQLERPEVMDIDLSQFQTRREEVIPTEIRKFSRYDRFKGTITSSVKGFFRKLFGR